MLLAAWHHMAAAASPGTAGFSFLRTNVGARAGALAGNFIAFSGDVHNIFYNPAGLAHLSSRTGSLTYHKHVLDFHAGFLAYGQPIWEKSGYCLAINYLNYGSFTRTDDSGYEDGEFGAGSLALAAGMGREIYPNLLVGASAKYFRSNIDQFNSDGFALDAGVLYRIPSQELHLAAAVYNLGFVNSAFVSDKDKLPFAYRFGISKRLEHLPLQLGISAYKFVDDEFRWSVGGEFTITERLFLRWGYDSIGSDMKVDSGKDPFAGISFGFGFNWRNYSFDYSFSSMGEVGTQNRITISGTF